MKTFFVIWFGQLISTLGSGLTGFALSVYVYQRTGSVTQLSLTLLAATVPAVLFSPLAGAVVDRSDRRWVMVLSDTGSSLSTLAIWLLLAAGQLEVWHIYLANAANATFGTFQRPAYMAATTLLVPKRHYGRASGLVQLGGAVGQILSPLLAGFLIAAIRIEGVILIDFATYGVAILTLSLIRIPRPQATGEGDRGGDSLLRQASYGWFYLKQRPGLLGLLVLFAFVNFALGFHSALLTPLVLSFTTTKVLGILVSVGGIGLLAGSLVMSAWGGARRKVHSLLASIFLSGLCLSLMGLRPSPSLIGAASLAFFALLPIANGSSQAIWQAKVAPEVQGRVFAIRGMIASVITPLSFLLAGPLADSVFEPLLAPGGALAGTVGQVTGVGAGRGLGLLLILMGCLVAVATIIGYLNPRIRRVEAELPDHDAGCPSPTQEPVAGAATAAAS